MSNLFEQIEKLYSQNLYSNIVSLASLVLSAVEHVPDLMDPVSHLQTLVYYADSLYQLQEYKRSEVTYKKALQFKKSLVSKTKSPKLGDNCKDDLLSDNELKFCLHNCQVSLKQYSQAIAVLQSISGKQRNAKINMALGKLYQQAGLERSAITCYREVLKECPLALDAAQGLLSIGVKGAEVLAIMLEGVPPSLNMEWLNNWIRAQAHLYNREYPQAVMVLKQLGERTPLRDNTDILVTLGQTYHITGNSKNALSIFQRAHTLDPLHIKGMETYACLLASNGQMQQLESLATRLLNASNSHPESWLALAHCCQASKKTMRALYFAHKALSFAPRCVEGLILKGQILMDMKKTPEAVLHFREALQVAPYRYEAHAGLVECYVTLRRPKEAAATALAACQTLGNTARVLTLYASVLINDEFTAGKAKGLLEKALMQDPTYQRAVLLLCDIYERSCQYEKVIALLEKQIEVQPSCQLHQRLGDLLLKVKEDEKAFDHYSTALNLDPSNTAASDGLQKMESQVPTETILESIDEPNDVDLVVETEEAESEGSESEVAWSDVDFNQFLI